PERDPSPEEAGVDAELLTLDAQALVLLATPLIDPDRSVFGHEEKGLVLARKAVALESDPGQRAIARDMLAWALFAIGRIDEAAIEADTALQEASDETRPRAETHRDMLGTAIDLELSPEGQARANEK